MPFAIRDFRPEDFETLWHMDQECFAPGISYSRPELKFFIRRRRSFTLVAEELVAELAHQQSEQSAGHLVEQDGGKPERMAAGNVGLLVGGFLVAQTGRTGHIITIDVAADVRRFGVGSQLLQAAEDRLRLAGSTSVGLETAVDNFPALAFYKRHGYDVIETVPRYYSNGVDALRMRKELGHLARTS